MSCDGFQFRLRGVEGSATRQTRFKQEAHFRVRMWRALLPRTRHVVYRRYDRLSWTVLTVWAQRRTSSAPLIKDVAVENSAVLLGSAWATRIPDGVKPSLL